MHVIVIEEVLHNCVHVCLFSKVVMGVCEHDLRKWDLFVLS